MTLQPAIFTILNSSDFILTKTKGSGFTATALCCVSVCNSNCRIIYAIKISSQYKVPLLL